MPTWAVGLALRPSGPGRLDLAGVLGHHDAEHEDGERGHREGGDHRAQRAAAGGELARLGAAAVAEAHDGGDQRRVDDEEEDEDDHDRHPVGVGDRLGVRRVRLLESELDGAGGRSGDREREPARTGQREWRSDGDGPRRRHCNRGGRGSGPRSVALLYSRRLAPGKLKTLADRATRGARRRGGRPRGLGRGAAAAQAAADPARRRRSPRSIGGPLSLAVLTERSKARDAALFGLQMWGFMQAHELPYDNPASLERRLKVRYPITVDRAARRRRAAERPPPASPVDGRARSRRSTGRSRSSTGRGSSSRTRRCSGCSGATSTAFPARRARWPRPTTSAASSTSRSRRRRRGTPPSSARRAARCGGSWATPARTSGASAPGPPSRRRSTPTRGRRCRRSTSRPR